MCTATETNFPVLPSIRQDKEETRPREKAWKVVPNWGVPKGVGGVWELCESFSAVGEGASSVHCEKEGAGEGATTNTPKALKMCDEKKKKKTKKKERKKESMRQPWPL